MELNPINWPERVPVELITSAGRPLAVTTEKLVEVIVAALPPGISNIDKGQLIWWISPG